MPPDPPRRRRAPPHFPPTSKSYLNCACTLATNNIVSLAVDQSLLLQGARELARQGAAYYSHPILNWGQPWGAEVTCFFFFKME